jgi:hypothetical protein
VPSYTNPQNLNRYSYVINNSLRYTDPTGHMQYEDSYIEHDGKCDLGDTSCNWVGKSRNKDKDKDEKKPLQLSTTINIGLQLGSPQDVQDYYGDYENNTNVPYFPGGNMQPNVCAGGSAAYGACLLNLFVSLVRPAAGPANPNNNFSLSFNLTYTEGQGSTISNIQWTNSYGGDAVFSFLNINGTVRHPGNGSYMPHDGQYQAIDGVYSSNNGIRVSGMVNTVINTPNGRGAWPYPLSYTVPALP